MLALRLPADIESRLAEVAKTTGRTKSSLAREAILEHLEDLEDYAIAIERMKKAGKGIPLSEILSEFADDLDDKP
jgi:RHH-type rel operon transcriptional repressor/antitoxin RelB